jgi:hypothetical protein
MHFIHHNVASWCADRGPRFCPLWCTAAAAVIHRAVSSLATNRGGITFFSATDTTLILRYYERVKVSGAQQGCQHRVFVANALFLGRNMQINSLNF